MKKKKILLISSSGGHFEQLSMLHDLSEGNNLTWITESTSYRNNADYYLIQTGNKDKYFLLKMFVNLCKSLYIWIKIRPDVVISTGAMVAIPMIILSRFTKAKLIYIETFARTNHGTRTGKFAYKYADLFIVQWEELLQDYPNATYGGTIY